MQRLTKGGCSSNSPGRRVIVRGAGEKTHTAVTERGDRAIEGGAHVADIAAERDERFSHDVPVPASVSVGGTRSPGRARSSHRTRGHAAGRGVKSATLASAHYGDPDIGKSRRNRRMGFVDSDPHPRDPREPIENGGRNRAGRGLDQPIAAGAERLAGDLDDLIITDGVRELVGTRSAGQVGVEDEIETETLSDSASCCITP